MRRRSRRPDSFEIWRLLDSAGVRRRPLNRTYPASGHWIAACPRCQAVDALWIDPDGMTFTLLCHCWKGQGDALALLGLLLTR
jgi:hypothetical protein